MTAALAVTGVTVRFAGITALDRVSFTVAPKAVHAVIGPNGAGKSTLFNVVSGAYRPAGCRTATRSGSRSPARCAWSPPCCCSTSRPPA